MGTLEGTLSPNQARAVGTMHEDCAGTPKGLFEVRTGRYGSYVQCAVCGAKVYRPRGATATPASPPVRVPELVRAPALVGVGLKEKGLVAPLPDDRSWYGRLATAWPKLGVGRGPHRVLLWGPPGVAKSSFAECFGTCMHFPLTEDTAPEDLLGYYTLQAGNMEWVDGAATESWRLGHTLVLEEFDLRSAAAGALLHALLDDASLAELRLPTKERLRPTEGYMIVATMNATPEALPEPLLNRFDVVLYAGEPLPGQYAQMRPAARAACAAHYKGLRVPTWGDKFTVRRTLAFERLSKVLGGNDELAAQLTFGSSAKEVLSVLASHASKEA